MQVIDNGILVNVGLRQVHKLLNSVFKKYYIGTDFRQRYFIKCMFTTEEGPLIEAATDFLFLIEHLM
jgi:hypothetical protein